MATDRASRPPTTLHVRNSLDEKELKRIEALINVWAAEVLRCHVILMKPPHHFLDAADHVATTESIACATDAQAQVRADGLLAASDYPAIEVWDHGRRVYRARKVDAAGEPVA